MGRLSHLLIQTENLKSDPLGLGFFFLLMSEYFNESNVTSRADFPKHSAFPKLVKTVLIKLCACVCMNKLGILLNLSFARIVICSLGIMSSG